MSARDFGYSGELTGAISWGELLATAETAPQVVALANEFLARLDREDVVNLPDNCKPRHFNGPDDFNAYAVDLMRAVTRELEEFRAVQRVSPFFQDVALKLAQLAGPSNYHPVNVWQPDYREGA